MFLSSGNHTPGSRFYSDLLDTLADLHLPAHTQASLKSLATLWLVPINARHVMTMLFNWSSHGGENEDKTLLLRSQRCHKGEIRHVSISARQQSLRVDRIFVGLSSELHYRIVRSTVPGKCRGHQPKGFTPDKMSHNSTINVSFCKIIIRLCHCMTAITRV